MKRHRITSHYGDYYAIARAFDNEKKHLDLGPNSTSMSRNCMLVEQMPSSLGAWSRGLANLFSSQVPR